MINGKWKMETAGNKLGAVARLLRRAGFHSSEALLNSRATAPEYNRLPIDDQFLRPFPDIDVLPEHGAVQLLGLFQQSAGAQCHSGQRIVSQGHAQIQLTL